MFGNLGYTTYEATKNSVEVLNNSIKNLSNLKSIGYRKTETSFVTTLNGEIAKHQNIVQRHALFLTTMQNHNTGIWFYKMECECKCFRDSSI